MRFHAYFLVSAIAACSSATGVDPWPSLSGASTTISVSSGFGGGTLQSGAGGHPGRDIGASTRDSAASDGSGSGGAQLSASGSGGREVTTLASGDRTLFDFDAGGIGDGSVNQDSACAAEVTKPTKSSRPIDIIFVIDNSGSMLEEIEAVKKNISVHFQEIIEKATVNYRVIMLSHFGQDTLTRKSVCIDPPLGGPAPSCNTLAVIPKAINEKDPFFHFSMAAQVIEVIPGKPNYTPDKNGVGSLNSLCRVLETYNGKPYIDDLHLYPQGWSTRLRKDAFKVFVEITDDGTQCTPLKADFKPLNDLKEYNEVQDSKDVKNPTACGVTDGPARGKAVADQWEAYLFGLEPKQFGTASNRNYIFHSIIGVKAKPNPLDAYGPAEEFQHEGCPTAAVDAHMCDGKKPLHVGYTYQELSKRTGGLRYPVCETASYDAVFKAVANQVVDSAALPCIFEMPKSSSSKAVNPADVSMQHTHPKGSATMVMHVSDLQHCSGSGEEWYYDSDQAPTKLMLCPSACESVTSDAGGEMQILIGCLSG